MPYLFPVWAVTTIWIPTFKYLNPHCSYSRVNKIQILILFWAGSNEAGPSSAKDTKDVTAIEAEEEEDPSNLQLAWAMFELAKTIFTKHIESVDESSSIRSELETKLSETYQYLGEVSIENEDYKQAVEDLTTCLTRRQKNLPEDSRSIAETHYQLGVALGFNLQFDEAVGALNDAINVLKKRIENLGNKTESKGMLIQS